MDILKNFLCSVIYTSGRNYSVQLFAYLEEFTVRSNLPIWQNSNGKDGKYFSLAGFDILAAL